MAAKPSNQAYLIENLRTLIEQQPDNVALRVQLAQLHLTDEQPAEALKLCQGVLNQEPANIEAMRCAAAAATALEDTATADGYARLLSVLDAAAPADIPTPAAAEPVANHEPVSVGFSEADQGAEHQALAATNNVVALRAVSAAGVDAAKLGPTLADVAGLEDVKRRIEISFLAPMRDPKLRQMYKQSLNGGLLLYGPPGCGKTFVARAIAGELGAAFMHVSLDDVLDMWMGESERKLHALFEQARSSAPCVIFFDEIDALGRKRGLVRESAHYSNLVNQLLTEMDGVDAKNEGVFVLGATNQPWDVDAALRRPGRFDRTILVLPPDAKARLHILADAMQERPAEGLDLEWIVKHTQDYSGADLVHLCDSATELALEDAIDSGKIRGVNQKDFKRAIKEVKSSIGPWLDSARNFAMYSNDEVYKDLNAFLRSRRLI